MIEESSEQVEVTIGPPHRTAESPPVAVANHVNVVYSPHDFRIMFSLWAVHPEEAGLINPDLTADVAIPATMIPTMIELLGRQYARWLLQFGNPVLGLPIPDEMVELETGEG